MKLCYDVFGLFFGKVWPKQEEKCETVWIFKVEQFHNCEYRKKKPVK